MANRFTQIDVDTNLVLGEFYNKRIPLMTDSSTPFTVQSPRMYMPFGISGFVPPHGPTKWNLDFVMKGWDENGGYVNRFYNWVKEVEHKVVSHIHENSEIIFGRELPLAEVRSLFNSNLKEAQNGYDPKLRVKADTWPDGKFKFKVYDSDQQEMSVDTVSDGLFKRHSGVVLFELNAVWFMNRRFGITWRTTQLQVFEPRTQHDERPKKCLIDFSQVADI
jgi:hypothetical protein